MKQNIITMQPVTREIAYQVIHQLIGDVGTNDPELFDTLVESEAKVWGLVWEDMHQERFNTVYKQPINECGFKPHTQILKCRKRK